ncbi:DUF411 domain-containing protein [Sphingomonas floccifaciens]|uniref:DUF411 domain-containing protein n=1 Tax=Sphingomonas floccifaciens TaxID=1844115 RepID=A0ABW4NEZ6_9SPHN
MKFTHLVTVAIAGMIPIAAGAADPVLMHRDPGCPCCEKWVEQVKAQFGRTARVVDDAKRPAFMKARGVPADLASCHTAVIDGMTFEGHVPIADMKRALAMRPKGVSGLAVAGMPMGSPGMEMPGMKAQPYDVVAFGPAGRRVFARHGG